MLKSVATAFLAFAITAAAQAPPIVPAGQTRQISPHVWAIEDKDTTPGVPNIGIIVGKTAALVVDTGMGPRNGATVLAEAEKLAAGKKLYLVTTHVHPEHDLGASAFPATTTMIRSRDQDADIAENGLTLADTFMQRSAINKELLAGATFRKADLHFDRRYTLDLGGLSVTLLAVGPNHTLGDTAIFVPADHVLFSGDVAMRGLPSFLPTGSSLSHWLVALQTLQNLNPTIVVPSHGPIGTAAYITTYQAFLTTVRDRVAALKAQGKSLDETVSALQAELTPQYHDTNRIAAAVRTAYDEVT